MSPYCISVFGTGSIGTRHLKVLREIPGVQPVAIPTRPARIRELEKAGYLTAQSVAEAARMGARLCIVATDTGRHARDALSAVENELDVLVEKPLSTDAPGASWLCRKIAEAGRKVFIGCLLRFSESLNTFREQLANVGRLHSVRIECQSSLPDWRPSRPYLESYSARAAEGGVLRDLIHEVDYAGWLFGWPTSLQARASNLGRLSITSEEAADLMWEAPDGCLVSVRLDYLTRPPRRRMIAAGEVGTLEWNGIEESVTLALADKSANILRSRQTRDEMLLAQDWAFVQASRGHNDPRLATGDDGVRALAVCDAARRAAETRREEKVDYP